MQTSPSFASSQYFSGVVKFIFGILSLVIIFS
jgi:hypothetical protein